LRRLLDTANAAEIANTPALLAEAKRVLSSLESEARWPAGVEGVKHAIGRRFAIYPQPHRNEAQWAAWWADYIAVLKDVPQPALEAAMVEWVKKPDSQFLPKPGELLALANNAKTREAMAYYTARAAIRQEQPFRDERIYAEAPNPRRPPRTPQDKAQVKAWAAEMVAAVAAKEAAQAPAFTPKPPPVDETGITAEMRSLLNRQRGEGL